MTNPAVAVHGLTKIFPVPFHRTRRSVRITRAERLRQEHDTEDYSWSGVTNTRSHRNFWARQPPRRKPRSSWFSPGEPVFLQISHRRGNAAFFWTPLRNDRRNIEEPRKRTARSCRAKQGARPPVGHVFQGDAATHRTGASIDSRPKAGSPG